jgi:hypothetical protein
MANHAHRHLVQVNKLRRSSPSHPHRRKQIRLSAKASLLPASVLLDAGRILRDFLYRDLIFYRHQLSADTNNSFACESS